MSEHNVVASPPHVGCYSCTRLWEELMELKAEAKKMREAVEACSGSCKFSLHHCSHEWKEYENGNLDVPHNGINSYRQCRRCGKKEKV